MDVNYKKILNMYFSQINSINFSILEMERYNVIRLYLTKTFRGRAQALGKPSRGQRT
jgi:ribosomal protein S13